MTRIATFLVIFLFACISIAAAQAPTPAANTITITGCIAPAQRDGSTAAKGTGTAATPETAATEANNPEPTGKFMLVDAAPAGSEPVAAEPKPAKPGPARRTSYSLRGREPELAKHVGHRVQITGTLMPPLAAKLPQQTAETAEGIRAVQVTSLKMIGTDCSARGTK